MATSSGGEAVMGQPHLAKQDLRTLVSAREREETTLAGRGGVFSVSAEFHHLFPLAFPPGIWGIWLPRDFYKNTSNLHNIYSRG